MSLPKEVKVLLKLPAFKDVNAEELEQVYRFFSVDTEEPAEGTDDFPDDEPEVLLQAMIVALQLGNWGAVADAGEMLEQMLVHDEDEAVLEALSQAKGATQQKDRPALTQAISDLVEALQVSTEPAEFAHLPGGDLPAPSIDAVGIGGQVLVDVWQHPGGLEDDRPNHPCPLCSSLHNKVFAAGRGPVIPIHPECDCFYIQELREGLELFDLRDLPPEAIVILVDWLVWLIENGHEIASWVPEWLEERARAQARDHDNMAHPRRYDDIDFRPTPALAAEAERGLRWREEHGRGGTAVGVARARDISNRKHLSPSTVRRMKAYFDRHEIDKKGAGWRRGTDGYPSPGRVAWALWGGDAGQGWAMKRVRQMNAADERTESMTQDRWIEEFALSDGWVKIFPVGTYRRGDRVLKLTKTKLREIAKNFKAGRPGYQPPVNEEHKGPRFGTIKNVDMRDDGLYAELDEKALAVAQSGGYGYVSPEVQWTGWQDKDDGKYYENVLAGLALTNYPYFGEEVTLFTSRENFGANLAGLMNDAIEQMVDDEMTRGDVIAQMAREAGISTETVQGFMTEDIKCGRMRRLQGFARVLPVTLEQLVEAARRDGCTYEEANLQEWPELYRDFDIEERRALAEEGQALPDGSYPIVSVQDLRNAISAIGRAKNPAQVRRHIIKRARELGELGLVPRDWLEGKDEMSEEVKEKSSQEPAGEPEQQQQITAEQFAELQARAALVDDMSVRLKATEDALAAAQRQANLAIFTQQAEQFTSLPQVDDFGEKLMGWAEKLGDDWQELYSLLQAADKAIETGALFVKTGSEPAVEMDEFGRLNAAVTKYQQDNAGVDYGAAMAAVAAQQPDLYNAYVAAQRRQSRVNGG